MARQVNVQTMVLNFQQGMSAGATRYKNGVQNVNENPAAKAADAVDNGSYQAGVNAAVASGRMQAKLRAVTLDGWKAAASQYGATAYAASAQKAAANYSKVAGAIAQAATQASAAAAAVSDPLGKVRAAINAMKTAFGKQPI